MSSSLPVVLLELAFISNTGQSMDIRSPDRLVPEGGEVEDSRAIPYESWWSFNMGQRGTKRPFGRKTDWILRTGLLPEELDERSWNVLSVDLALYVDAICQRSEIGFITSKAFGGGHWRVV